MTTKLEWNNSYCVNDPILDEQHKHIFRIINSLPDQLDKDHARQTVLELFAYAWDHFHSEEELMKEIGYPELAKHKELHADILRQMSQIARNNFPDSQALSDFKRFATDWVSQHVLKDDMDYVAFSRNKNATS